MKKGFWIIMGLALMAAMTCSCTPSEDQERPATVVEVVNKVDAHPRPKDDWQPAVVDMAIYGGGQLRTGAASSARLELLEGVVRLAAETIFTVKESTTREGRLETTLFLQAGRLWAHLTTSQPHEFSVETASAVAAVRDTCISVKVDPDQRTQVSVAEGEVVVTAQGVSVTVVAGQQVIVKPGQPPSPPEPMSDEERRLWATEGEMPEELAPPTPTPVPPKPTKPPEPTYLNMNLGGEPSTIDPALAIETSSVQCAELLFLGLTDYDDETSEVIPELAEKWEVSADGLKWTFTMRQDIYWVQYDPASGKVEKKRPVTAHDVEYGVKRSLDPAMASDYAYVLYIIKGAEAANTGEGSLDDVGVRALDDYTVEFELVAPAAYFPGIAGMWPARPVPQEVIEEYGDQWAEPQNIWTNGPYLLGTWKHDDRMVLAKNPEHPDAADVQIDRINFFMVTEDSTALAMYENGELDVTDVPSGDVLDGIIAAPREKLATELNWNLMGCTYSYGFNTTKPPVDNKHVRRALSYAIDRQKLIDTVLKGGQKPAKTFACPGIFGSPAEDPSFQGIEFDPDTAKKELEMAGYPNGEGWPSDVVLMFDTSEDHEKIAEFIQANWRDVLGIEVNVENQEWKVYLDTLTENPPQVFRLGWALDYPDPHNFLYPLHSTKGQNHIKWSNAEFDQLVEQAAFETDPEKRKELYRRAEEVLCVDEAGIIPIYYDTRVVLAKPYVERTYASAGGMEHIWKWKVKAHTATPAPVPSGPTPTPTPEKEKVVTPTPTPTTTPTPTPTPTATPTFTPAPTAKEYVEECNTLLDQGKPLLVEHIDCTLGIELVQSAIEKATEALKLNPNDPKACLCRAKSRIVLGGEELNGAIRDLECAVEGLAGNDKVEAETELEKLRESLAATLSVSMGPILCAEGWDWEAGEAFNQSTTFSGCKKEIWCRWELEGANKEVALVQWHKDNKLACQHNTDELEGSYDGSGWTIDPGQECTEPGTYRVEVWIGLTKMTEGGFTVTDQAAAPPTSAPPTILSIDFPSQIPADGTGIDGSVRFRDPDGDVNWVTFDVVSASDFESFAFNPVNHLIEGDVTEGVFNFHTWSNVVQQVNLRVTLFDDAGNSSAPVPFSFRCE